MFSRQLPFSAPSSPHSKPLSIYSLLCFPGSCILGLFFGYPRLGYFPSLILFRFIWLSTPQFLPYTNQRFLNGLYSVSYLLTAQRSLNLRFLSLSCFLNGVWMKRHTRKIYFPIQMHYSKLFPFWKAKDTQKIDFGFHLLTTFGNNLHVPKSKMKSIMLQQCNGAQ